MLPQQGIAALLPCFGGWLHRLQHNCRRVQMLLTLCTSSTCSSSGSMPGVLPTVVILEARLVAWCVEPWRHIKTAVPVCTYYCEHLLIAARHCVLISKVSHDEHGVKVEHLRQQAHNRKWAAVSFNC